MEQNGLALTKTFRIWPVVLAAGILFAFSLQARASLGDKTSSVENDRRILGFSATQKRIVNHLNAQEMSAKGVTIRQFSSQTDQVFAVAWTGNADSQLPRLLGVYAKDYAQWQKSHPQKQTIVPYKKVVTKTVVLEFWNLLRHPQGKAYIPTLMPAGVTPSKISMK